MATPDQGPDLYSTLAHALAAFHEHLPTVAKGNTAKVEGSRGSYSYDYADLKDVSAAILPALANVGLTWITRPDTAADGTIEMHYSLIHAHSGQSIEGSVAVGRKGDRWQDLGSALTYARRYMLVSVTGVAPGGDDNDGQDARAGAAPQQAAPKQYLPVGLYDLSKVKSRKAAADMFYIARGAGHLNLYVETPTGDELLFGDWLRVTGAQYPEVEPEDEPKAEAEAEMTDEQKAEAAERAAIEAHEAELARQEKDDQDHVAEARVLDNEAGN
ncbi:ERF family ssDNA binding protein [Microbacterium phage ClearAsMud]|uniref:ERF family ssDNA binding protein n=1 Tax=Microbacterium phage ClearAsMud TaxID=2743404 RepID=A0A7G9A0X3_9CAUD|nr:ERF family ssDNA binding protein [Microbacterium phage ClearAsMud]QNL30262.1 ERF family ssDNA binding protein [Microbacterium phage ClearAsMud]